MRCEIWIVEAVDDKGNTLWRTVWDHERNARDCHTQAEERGEHVHIWRL